MSSNLIATGADVRLRHVDREDMERISEHEYSVSVVEPHGSVDRLVELHDSTGFWTDDAGAVAIVELETGQMIGTLQCYRSGPCIHGLEIGYIIHAEGGRGKGYAAQAARLFSDHLFEQRTAVYRHQLLIEVWNTASWKVAERAGFVREGVLRSCGFGDGDPADAFVYSRTAKDRRQQLASHNGD